MFHSSSAIVQTHDRNWFNHLQQMLRQASFSDIRHFPNTSDTFSEFRRGPLPFIFLHSTVPPEESQKAIKLIRSHNDINVRFLPIIVIAEKGDAERLISFIQQGCDDIILSPFTVGQMLQRLRLQLNRPRDFYQTVSYFGPDRRLHALTKSRAHGGRGHGDHFYRHFSIQRHQLHGIKILSTEAHIPGKAASSGKESKSAG